MDLSYPVGVAHLPCRTAYVTLIGFCGGDVNVRIPHWVMVLGLGIILSTAVPAVAQDNYEIQVYGSDTIPANHIMVELHSNFTIDGTKTVEDGQYPTEHAWHAVV